MSDLLKSFSVIPKSCHQQKVLPKIDINFKSCKRAEHLLIKTHRINIDAMTRLPVLSDGGLSCQETCFQPDLVLSHSSKECDAEYENGNESFHQLRFLKILVDLIKQCRHLN